MKAPAVEMDRRKNTKSPALRFKVAKLRELLERAERRKRSAQTLGLSTQHAEGYISGMHAAIEVMER